MKVKWQPNFSGNPGSHFYAQYRKKGEPSWQNSDPQINEEFVEIKGLETGSPYEIRVVSVDGTEETESASQLIETSESGEFLYFFIRVAPPEVLVLR